MINLNPIKIKRVYDEVHLSDGKRILVDRIWPRGLSKEKAAVYIWMKDLAPSHELRKGFDHKPDRFEDFKENYLKELSQDDSKMQLLQQIRSWASNETVTLVYAAKSEIYNQAVILQQFIVCSL